MPLVINGIPIPTNRDLGAVGGIPLETVRVIINGQAYEAWKLQKNYFIIYSPNGGSGAETTREYPAGVQIQVDACSFNKTGYLFEAWNKKADGTGTGYPAGGGAVDVFGAGETGKLYAKWKPITYTVAYAANGGAGTVSGHTVDYGQEFALALNGFNRYGHIFAGWGNAVDSGANYQPGQKVSNLLSAHNGVKTLYAQWSHVAPVEFLYNGGVQTWAAPHAGWYRLEAYGAQGGDGNGHGGYSAGDVYLPAGYVLSVVVGGAGAAAPNAEGAIAAGGFNGGGNGSRIASGGGGGTHIGNAGANNLTRYCPIGNIFCIAGGGGGGGKTHISNNPNNCRGGNGGGLQGDTGTNYLGHQDTGKGSGQGGTQSAAGRHGGYGFGGNATEWYDGGGGGGGYYGGDQGYNYNGSSGAGGGSGFAGNGLTNISLQNGVRSGHGLARVTFLRQ